MTESPPPESPENVPPEGKGENSDLHEAFNEAGRDAHQKWGPPPSGHLHHAKARIEVTLEPNPGAIKEYIVFLSKN